MKIRSAVLELLHAERWIDRRTDRHSKAFRHIFAILFSNDHLKEKVKLSLCIGTMKHVGGMEIKLHAFKDNAK
jgi:hypothetical protein